MDNNQAMYSPLPKLSMGRGRSIQEGGNPGGGDRENEDVKNGVAGMAIASGGIQREGGSGAASGDASFRNMILPALHTRPPNCDKKGQGGNVVDCLTNYVALKTRPDFKIFQYHVSFIPTIDSKAIRQKMVRDRVDLFGDNPVFDGMILYQADRFKDEPLVFEEMHPTTDERVTVTVKLTKELVQDDPQCLTLLNLCNRRVFEMAGYVQLGRNFYDCNNVSEIPEYNIEIWPGMISAIRCHENGLLLVSEMSHKVLRTDTVLDFMKSTIKADPTRGQENVMQALVGHSVLTRYNNKTYRVDDIRWDLNPGENTFEMDDGRRMTFAEYYWQNYQKRLIDPGQPLLMSRGKRKAGSADDQWTTIYLVPELCVMTGITDEMRENRKMMQKLAMHTRVEPSARIEHVRKYLKTMEQNASAKQLFTRWGIELDRDVLHIKGRELEQEQLFFGRNIPIRYDRAQSDWSRECRTQRLDDPRNLSKWLIVFSPATKAAAEEFYKHVKVLGQKCGMEVGMPVTAETEDDRIASYLTPIRKITQEQADMQIVVAVVPNDLKTRYDAIKKQCCLEIGIPSQVVKARSLDKNTVSVCSKILVQMNCKLGGSLWRVNIPMKNAMIIGYDLYTDSSSRGKKVGAAVFSLNEQFTKWYSQCAFHGEAKELVANLVDFCTKGLKKYEKVNGRLPDRIILFRDGVGDGHIPVVFSEELPQVQKAFLNVGGDDYKPRFAFVIVTKRVHSRYFKAGPNNIVNPMPGTVVDDVITRPERYDFYLVPQSVRQGTVTPVSYNVIFDESGLAPANMQKLAYKLCHMYYNWQGTIRVPAPCQFAHKLAFLVGQTLHEQADENLADKLFFL